MDSWAQKVLGGDHKLTYVLIATLQVIVFCFIWFDVSPLRALFGLLFYSVVPGYLVLSLIDLHERPSKVLLYSLGLSIFFLMVMGLIVNELYLLLGVENPLSKLPLLFASSAVIFGLCIIGFLTKKRGTRFDLSKALRAAISPKVLLTTNLLLLPVLSFLGAKLLDYRGDNLVPVLLFVLIAVVVILVATKNRGDQASDYVNILSLYSICLSILFSFCLRSEFVVGYDIHTEYFTFQLTHNAGHWAAKNLQTPYNTALSITALPTVLTALLGVDAHLIFKVIYPFLVSFVPVCLYFVYSQFLKKSLAFLSVIVLMGTVGFSNIPSLARQEIALLLFGLVILLLFDENLNAQKKGLLIAFSFGIALSHYTTAYVYLILISLTLFVRYPIRRHSRLSKIGLTKFGVVAVAAFTFFWYGQVTGTPFTSVIQVLIKIAQYSLMEARSAMVTSVTSPYLRFSAVSIVNFTVGYGVKALIVLGTICLAIKNRKAGFSFAYIKMACVSLIMILLFWMLPVISKTYNADRFFLQLLYILAPTCIFGFLTASDALGKYIGRLIKLKKRYITHHLLSLFVVMYLLSGTNFVAQIGGEPVAMAFNNQGNQYEKFYVYEEEVTCIQWLSIQNPNRVYADRYGVLRLQSYGGIIEVDEYENVDKELYGKETIAYVLHPHTHIPKHVVIFLRYENIANQIIKEMEKETPIAEIPQLSHALGMGNRVYDNGKATVYEM